jgi:arylsulfatase I/J
MKAWWVVALSGVHPSLSYAGKSKPHILYILADDLGWANVDWHHDITHIETATPFLSSLVQEGVELDRMYSFKFCSPSRSAIQSGRNPIHVNVQNLDPTFANREDPIAGYAGIPREMTGLGAVMKSAGYATHFVGKWDAGMATPDHTPRGRGYDTSLLYFHHLNDYWDSKYYDDSSSEISTCPGHDGISEVRPVDLWQGNTTREGPARGLNNVARACKIATPQLCFASENTIASALLDCPAYPTELPSSQGGGNEGDVTAECQYEDGLFEHEVHQYITRHDSSQPMFLFWALHLAHAPLQVPKRFLDEYRHLALDDWRRQRYLAMTRYMDSAVANITSLLKSKNMYKDTLIVFTSDNGGAIYRNGSAGASNWPLKGGKASNWEGGIRVNAFASGGMLPMSARGRKLTGLGAIWDWYGTFAALAGVNPHDLRAHAASLPPIDALNLWPYIIGDAELSPRTSIPLGSSTCIHQSAGCINLWGNAPSHTEVAGLIMDDRGTVAFPLKT